MSTLIIIIILILNQLIMEIVDGEKVREEKKKDRVRDQKDLYADNNTP